MTCAAAIMSTMLCLDFIADPPTLPSGFVVGVTEPNNPPRCIVVSSDTCQELPVCVHLGGIVAGCGPLAELFDVPVDPMPGEAFFITFEPL